MRGVFWNSDELGDPAKHLAVNDMVRENKLDFIALLETDRSNFSTPFLTFLAGGFDYNWFCLPPHGRSGGVLVGFNKDTLEMQSVVAGDFCVKIHFKSKVDGFIWALVAVYGAAQDEKKPDFLSELVRICDGESPPMVVGGVISIL